MSEVKLSGIGLLRALSAIWCAVVASIVIGKYVDIGNVMSLVSALIPIVGGVGIAVFGATRGDKRFTTLSSNAVVVTAFASILLPIFLLSRSIIPTEFGVALYIIFVLSAVALMDIEDVPIIENEPATVRGFAFGALAGLITSIIVVAFYGVASKALVVGYIASNAFDWFSYLPLFLLMLFVVAVPEELLFRVLLLKVGSYAVNPVVGGLASAVMWFGLHAITRVPDYYALACLGIVYIVITIMYYLYGFVSAVATHALYNVGVVILYDIGFEIGSLVVVALAVVSFVVAYVFRRE